MSVPNTGGLQVERNLAPSDFCGLEKHDGLLIEVGSGIFTPTSVTI
jgi:hypothetical protein